MKLFRFCMKYLLRFRSHFLVYIVLNIVAGLVGVVLPIVSGGLINNLTITKNQKLLFYFVGFFVMLSLLQMVIQFVSKYLYIKLQTRAGYMLNTELIRHLQKLSLSFFTHLDTAYMSSRVNNDSNDIIIFCINIIINILLNAITLLVTVAILILVNPLIAIILIALLIAYIGIYNLFKKRIYEKNLAVKEEQANFFSKLMEQISNIRFIKIHSSARLFAERLDNSFQQLLKKLISSQKLGFLFSGCDTFIRLAAQIAVFVIGGLAVIAGNMTIGFFTIILSYFNMMMGAGQYFYNLGSSYQGALVSYHRVMEIVSSPIPKDGESILNTIDSITVQKLRFNHGEKEIINEFSCNMQKGYIYALTGPNGAGKTTLLNLLLGLYPDEYRGKIAYNNSELHELNMEWLRASKIGMTEQEPILIPDTLYNNLVLFDDVSKQHLESLIQLIGLDKYISELPQGLETVINEKSNNISGGEKQKVSIIRQFLKDPEIMIFDEPTSALDQASRKRFFLHLQSIKNQKIIIIVSHEREVIEASDVNIVLHTLKKEV